MWVNPESGSAKFSSFYVVHQKTAPQKPTPQVEETCAMEVILNQIYNYTVAVSLNSN